MCWESAIPVSSSRAKPSIFFAHRYSVVCVTAEKGKTFAKGARKSKSARKISRCARNDGMGGMGLFHVAYNGYVWKTPFTQRHPERSPRSFLHTDIASYVWQWKRGKLLRKEQERAECKEDFSLRPSWRHGDGWLSLCSLSDYYPSYRIYLCLFRALFMIDASRKWYRRISWKKWGAA